MFKLLSKIAKERQYISWNLMEHYEFFYIEKAINIFKLTNKDE